MTESQERSAPFFDMNPAQSDGEATSRDPIGSPQSMLPRLVPSDLDESQLALYRKIVDGARSQRPGGSTLADEFGTLRGPFNALLMNPILGDAIQRVGVAIRYGTALPGRIRELAIMDTAVATRCVYEFVSHTPTARHEGLSDEHISAIREGRPILDLADDEISARTFVASLLEFGDADDEILNDVIARLGYVAVVELVFVVGYYELLARSLKVWRVPIPEYDDEQSS